MGWAGLIVNSGKANWATKAGSMTFALLTASPVHIFLVKEKVYFASSIIATVRFFLMN